MSFLAGVGALTFVFLAARAGVAFVIDDRGPGEGGRAASLGFFLVFVSFAFVAGEYAWRGRRTALVAYRTPGRVTIDADTLTIDAPGTATRPLEIHRAWVKGAERIAGYETSAPSFAATLVKGSA